MKRRSLTAVFFTVLVHEIQLAVSYAWGKTRLALLDEEQDSRRFQKEFPAHSPIISYVRQPNYHTLTLRAFGWRCQIDLMKIKIRP